MKLLLNNMNYTSDYFHYCNINIWCMLSHSRMCCMYSIYITTSHNYILTQSSHTLDYRCKFIYIYIYQTLIKCYNNIAEACRYKKYALYSYDFTLSNSKIQLDIV